MNPECKCPLSGYCNRHKINKNRRQHQLCKGEANTHDCGLKYWQAWEDGQLGATQPDNPIHLPDGFCGKTREGKPQKTPIVSRIGDELHAIIHRETGVVIPCADCRKRINLLNTQTQYEAKVNRETTISDIVGNAKRVAPKLWQRLAVMAESAIDNAGLLPYSSFARKKVGAWVDEAIKNGELPQPVRPVRQHVPRRHGRAEPTQDQTRLWKKAISHKPVPKPFNGKPVINLVWHLWPVPGTWQWHVERLNELIPKCDGQVIIGITVDEDTDQAEVVKAAIKGDVHFIVTENVPISSSHVTPVGEQLTAIPAFEMLDKSIDSITIYGHGKGARDHTKVSEPVRIWTECMYETVSFNVDQTIKAMEEGYDVVGSFRTFGNTGISTKMNWHYAGTFFNFRTKILEFAPPFQLRYGGVESWLGDFVPARNSYCVIRDNSPIMYQYNEKFSPNIIAEQLHWESERFGGVKMEQHAREFDWLVSQLSDCRSLLIIGSRHGGMEHYLAKRLPQLDGNIVSVDIDPLPGNTAPRLIVGSSADKDVQAQIIKEQAYYDAVFIDGDHLAEGVRADWEFAKSVTGGQIFFHDFTPDLYHRATGCEVHKVWPEIQTEAKLKGWKVSSKTVGCGWGGISQVDTKNTTTLGITKQLQSS